MIEQNNSIPYEYAQLFAEFLSFVTEVSARQKAVEHLLRGRGVTDAEMYEAMQQATRDLAMAVPSPFGRSPDSLAKFLEQTLRKLRE